MKYYDIKDNWRKLKKLYRSNEAKNIWYPDMCHNIDSKAEEFGFEPNYPKNTRELTPSDFDGCDWRSNKPGRKPEFWKYVCHGASHDLVKLNLYVITKAEPDRTWGIISINHDHSTIWDGKDTLFDANFQAFGITADRAYELAISRDNLVDLDCFEIPK